MTTLLNLYNSASLMAGERFISSLTVNQESRYLIDQVIADGGIKACLEEAQWHFAMRTIRIDYDASVAPSYGYNRAFSKPTDWVLTSGLCADEYFRVPLTRYFDEAGYWYSDLDSVYVRYVSNDVNYGANLAIWPESFNQFVASHIASKIILKLSNSEELKGQVLKLREKLLKEAKNRAAMTEATSFPAQGSWSRSRNRFPARKDGGNTSGNLLG